MTRPIYRVYVEGGLHHETPIRRIALRVAQRARSDGWNVSVMQVRKTLLGVFEVRVD